MVYVLIKNSDEIPIMTEQTTLIPLLDNYYGDYFEPINWEPGKKARNFFAKIKKGKKNAIFDRKFLVSYKLDNKTVFKRSDLAVGEIIEQKAVFIKGTKQEITFHGFFIIIHEGDQILGEKITQKDALEYFECKDVIPDIDNNVKNTLRVKLGTVIRKLAAKYGDEMVSEIMTDILEDYFPKI